MAKKELTISEFREIIKEEALKLKKRLVLENEKKALEAELKSLSEGVYEEDMYEEEGLEEMEIEEGMFGPDKSEIEANRQKLSREIDALLAKVPDGMEVMGDKDTIMQKAADNNFAGEPWLRKSRTGKVVLGYEPKLSRLQRIAQAAGGSLRGGHTFGSGGQNE